MNSRNHIVLAIILLPLFSFACKSSTEPTMSTMLAHQVGGCNSVLAKGTSGDSCFSYQFKEVFVADFCVLGNCCPDSNRFSFRHSVSQDTIIVTVSDTAAQSCRCMCSYLVHIELYDLTRNEYLLLCVREDYSNQYIIYSTRILRG